MKTKTNQILIILAILVLIPLAGYAQTPPTYTALEPLPCIPGGGVTCTGIGNGNLMSSFSFQTYIQYIFNLVIAIAAASAVFMIVYGGLQYMTTDAWTDKDEGKKKVKNAVLGLLLVLSSYMILRTIDPRLVAIPQTLVAPLNLNYGPSLLSSYFSDLEKDAASYHLDMATFQTNRLAAQATMTEAERQKLEISDQIRFLMGDTDTAERTEAQIDALCRGANTEQINALCLQRAQKDVAIKQAADSFSVNTAIAGMRVSVQHCGQTMSDPSCFDNLGEQAKISAIFNKYSGKYELNQQNQLYAYKRFADSWFLINKELNKQINGGVSPQEWRSTAVPALATLKLSVNSYAATTNYDSNVLADMRAREEVLTRQVEEKTAIYDQLQ